MCQSGRGDHEVAVGGTGSCNVMEPSASTRAIKGSHVHVLLVAAGGNSVSSGNVNVVRRNRIPDHVALGSSDLTSLGLVTGGLRVGLLHGEKPNIHEIHHLGATQLLDGGYIGPVIYRRTLHHGVGVEGTVLDCNLHLIGTRSVIPEGARDDDKVVNSSDALDFARLAGRAGLVVDEASPIDTQVLVILRNEVDSLFTASRISKLGTHWDVVGVSLVLVRIGHLAKAHEGVLRVRSGGSSHVDSTAGVMYTLNKRGWLAADHVARGGVRSHV
mmetsp:Transcript_37926/g.59172  ORF Transcript_37926/g.59172 Transcript_37926/m.59172 type:complete len:272 (-) Transcript_37926:1463-2278(-)